MMGLGGGSGPSRALCVSNVPPEATYEELFDAVGAYGNLESIKLLADKRQAFVNFVEPAAAYHLMMQSGAQIVLAGETLPLLWAKARPVPRELVAAIRQGATRNLYVANVPELMTESSAATLFEAFGEVSK